jgi:hypothetical protein
MDIISTSPVAEIIQAVSAGLIVLADCALAIPGAYASAPTAPQSMRRRQTSLFMQSP